MPAACAATELGEMLKNYAEKNIAAAQGYVNKLSQAKDFQDVIRVQTEFMQMQFNAFSEQTKGLSETFTKAATVRSRRVSKNLIKLGDVFVLSVQRVLDHEGSQAGQLQ
jgi:hypothetical protein